MKCKCKHNRCKTCPNFVESPTFHCSNTEVLYEVQNNLAHIDCKSKNIVYLLTCKECNIQYVGETGQSFNIRNNSHRSSTVHSQRHTGCPIIHEHFTEGQCKGREYWCHIIEKIPDTGTDKQQKDKRKAREGF